MVVSTNGGGRAAVGGRQVGQGRVEPRATKRARRAVPHPHPRYRKRGTGASPALSERQRWCTNIDCPIEPAPLPAPPAADPVHAVIGNSNRVSTCS
jgi:hypothetical protein